jgi:Spy/CpxP family protein refolding chaperone
MVMLPGVALLASEGIALAQTPSAAASGLSAHKVLKFTSKYGNSRSAYKIPKTSAKQEKYLNFMSALLNLSPAQKDQAAGIYANALSSRTTMRTSVKTAHQGLGTAVQNNDTNGIHKAAAEIGRLAAQRRATGALTNAAFYQILTADQRALLTQFQTKTKKTTATA